MLNNLHFHTLEPENWNQNFRSLLIQIAMTKVNDYHTAEDIVQDTFLSAWKSSDRFRGECSEKTFLTGILKNKIIDFYRKRGRRPVVPVSQIENNDTEEMESWIENRAGNANNSSPATTLLKQDFLFDLDRAIGQLPEKMATAYRLSVLDEKPTEEVTARLNITPTNLWVMVHRAKKLLRTELQEEWFGENFDNPLSR
ncbi:MAG: RNA polymerase sigma factor [Verrucomicrobiales bacterium]|nr:RNA polymerase sigma factor [Verrucomicrobiales bacterium]